MDSRMSQMVYMNWGSVRQKIKKALIFVLLHVFSKFKQDYYSLVIQ